MSTEKVIFEAELKAGSASQSIGSIKRELKEANEELIKAQQNFGQYSREAITAAKRVAELRDSIQEAKETADLFDPGKKFQVFSGALSTVAGGFSAVQGAMALVGSESEDLQKQLLKVQGALALSQGLSVIADGAKDFQRLAAVVGGSVVKAFTTLRGALIATGIGALAVAVGLVLTNWEKLVDILNKSIPGFTKVSNFFKNFQQVAAGTLASVVEGFRVLGDVVSKIFDGDFSGAIDSAKKFGERVAVAYNAGFQEKDQEIKKENSIKDRKFQLDLEEAKGKDVRSKRIKLMQDELSLLTKGSEEYNAKLIEIEKIRTDIRNESEKNEKEIAEAKKKRAQEVLDFQKRIAEAEVELTKAEKLKRKEDAAKEKAERDKEFAERIADARAKRLTELDIETKDLSKSQEDRIAAMRQMYEMGKVSEQDFLNFKKSLRQQDVDNQAQTVNELANTVNAVSTIAGVNAETQKKIAIASTLIDTYFAAQKAYTSQILPGDPTSIFRGAIAAGAAVAAGLARVAVMSRTSISAPTAAIPSSGGATPPPPTLPQSTQGISLQGANQPILTRNIRTENTRVYVLESDITNKQKTVKDIRNKATIR